MQETPLQSVRGGGGVAGQATTQPGADGAGEDGQHDVEVNVEGHGAGQGVEVEAADGFGEALLDVHPAGIALDERFDRLVVVVGDQDGGLVVAQSTDDQLPDGAGVARQCGVEGFSDLGAAVPAGAVEVDG